MSSKVYVVRHDDGARPLGVVSVEYRNQPTYRQRVDDVYFNDVNGAISLCAALNNSQAEVDGWRVYEVELSDSEHVVTDAESVKALTSSNAPTADPTIRCTDKDKARSRRLHDIMRFSWDKMDAPITNTSLIAWVEEARGWMLETVDRLTRAEDELLQVREVWKLWLRDAKKGAINRATFDMMERLLPDKEV